ncbi:hypothetical protein GF318_03270 [Candidatus Micrarchaeota archaeon]|nr:hypothetical protein [Candidatus Micrarchaeota archaeon]
MKAFLAPIHGYSDFAFRMLCQEYGAQAACIPLVSSTSVLRDISKLKRIDAHPQEKNLGIQLFGISPEELGRATALLDETFPFVSWFNLNCGCPSERITECGAGSAMMTEPELVGQSVRSMKNATSRKVSVKLRISGRQGETLELCRAVQGCAGVRRRLRNCPCKNHWAGIPGQRGLGNHQNH